MTAVADLAEQGPLPHLVVDPVLVSSTGHPLLEPDGVAAYLERLLPHALVVTPNLREAAVLGRARTSTRSGRSRPGSRWPSRSGRRGARYVVVKGGHLTDSADDVVAGPEGVVVLPGKRVHTGNDHGTGCSLSAAVAAHLARGPACSTPSRRPRSSWHRALAGGAGWRLGAGHGPLDHFGWSSRP